MLIYDNYTGKTERAFKKKFTSFIVSVLKLEYETYRDNNLPRKESFLWMCRWRDGTRLGFHEILRKSLRHLRFELEMKNNNFVK